MFDGLKRFIDIAIDEANQSDYYHKLGCVIFDKKQVLSQGRNYALKSAKKLHPKFQKWDGSIHAEVDAILKARTDLRKSDMIVIRINKKGELRMAKPCEFCMKYIQHVGIRKIYYSINQYPYIEMIKL